MQFIKYTSLSVAVIAVLSACSTTPPQIALLDEARTVVPQLESSARTGVAATNVSNARKSLDAANRLVDSGGTIPDIEFEAQKAVLSAKIAQEKILTAQAQEEMAKGTEQQQVVLLESREREIGRSAQIAADARQIADASNKRVNSLESELADLKARQTERGLVLTLGDVLFDTGGSSLKSGAYATLDRLATALKDKPGRSVLIEGHTDNVGSDENNQALSMRRAESVQSALMQRGVASDQIKVMGRGESSPVASNEDAAGRQQNRRVDLIFAEATPKVAAEAG
jgi:outer membrane protein OmpA-like peptidoglycan-associated protein